MATDLSLAVIPNAMAALNALTPDQLDIATVAQLWEWADEELQRLARTFGLILARAENLVASAGQSVYALPADHLATIQAEFNSKVLRPSSVHEIEAGDAGWEDRTDYPPVRFLEDWLGTQNLRFYPIPLRDGLWAVVYQATAPTVSATQTSAPVAAPVADIVALRVIAEARRREGDSQMPEAVKACEQLTDLYDAALKAYFGGGM